MSTCTCLRHFTESKPIYKSECALCCLKSPKLLKFCFSCRESFCESDSLRHAAKHPSHNQFLLIETEEVEEVEDVEQEMQVKEPKLENQIVISAPKTPTIKQSYAFECTKCATPPSPIDSLPASLASVCRQIASTPDASIKTQMAADSWTEPTAQVCEHSFTLQQDSTIQSSSKCCTQCELTSNLWMCLTCGALGCGRRQFDGSGGNGHALEHYKATGHQVAIKLGTIVYRGPGSALEADLFCYACDDAVIDPELQSHLGVLGIDPQSSEKTEKSTGELQLNLNLTHTYAMTDSNGAELEPRSGPGMRGMVNLGNSCYFASVLQAIRLVCPLLSRNHSYADCSALTCSECCRCQLVRIISAIESESPISHFKKEELNISPLILKKLLTKGHSEFSSARQQDASEFLNYLLEERPEPEFSALTRKAFQFSCQSELQCRGCGRIQTSTEKANCLTLPAFENSKRSTLLASLFEEAEVIERRCDGCDSQSAQKRTKLASLPQRLAVVVNRTRLTNWVPEKVDCRVEGMEEDLELKAEPELKMQHFKVEANTEMLGELLLMGIEESAGRRALIACKNSSLDSAMNLIFSGGEIAVEEPIDEGALEMLISAGFDRAAAEGALKASKGDLEVAMNSLLNGEIIERESEVKETIESAETVTFKLRAFITHIGTSVHCGHYVAHLKVKDDDEWVLFNDEKVAKAEVEDESFPISRAYIYIYERQ